MHVITVIQLKHAIIEAVAVAVVIAQVVQQVDIIIINHNGRHLMVVPVVICGLVIIKLVVVVMSGPNNRLVAVMVIVNRIKVGGTVQHETKNKISNIPTCDA